MYIHHLVSQMDSNIGSWFDLESKLSGELRWMRIEKTGSPSFWPSRVHIQFHGSSFEQFVKTNEDKMPVHNLLLRALENVALDSYTWRTLWNYMKQICPTRKKGAQNNAGGQIGVPSSKLPEILDAFFRLQSMAEDSQLPWKKIVHVLQDVRRKEPQTSGWVFSGYPY
jgi:hypothetical protein